MCSWVNIAFLFGKFGFKAISLYYIARKVSWGRLEEIWPYSIYLFSISGSGLVIQMSSS